MNKVFEGRDFVDIGDYSREETDFILRRAGEIEQDYDEDRKIWPNFSNSMVLKYCGGHKHMTMASLFFEPSTRTNLSFQAAMTHMGGIVWDFDEETSSRRKKETLRDTCKMVDGYCPDVVVARTKDDGSARLMANSLCSPFINAGDGQNQHPTQTLLDLYTINEIRGEIDGSRIAMAGDLKYGRTVHSLLSSLGRYDSCSVICIAPHELKMPKSFIQSIEGEVEVEERGLGSLEESLGEVDIVYMTRIQEERLPVSDEQERKQMYERFSRQYCLTKQMLERVGENIKVMHPLPRVDEISRDVDSTDYEYYFKQARNGLYVRMALLDLLVRGEDGKR